MSQADQDIAVEASLKTSGLGSAAVVDDNVVPTIDLSGDPEEVAAQLWQAATTVGFLSVTNHGIPQAVIDDGFGAAEAFFAQPRETKLAQSPGDMKNNAGFEHFSQVRPSTGVADQKESLQVTARAGVMEGRWPSDDFEAKAQVFLAAANTLAGKILDLLEPKAVPANKPGTISKSHTLWADDGQCTLRFLHYPPVPADATKKLLADGYWRAGPHVSYLSNHPLLTSPYPIILTLVFPNLRKKDGLGQCHAAVSAAGTGRSRMLCQSPHGRSDGHVLDGGQPRRGRYCREHW
jgi:hypothetical protein